jgi:hypothetical protein
VIKKINYYTSLVGLTLIGGAATIPMLTATSCSATIPKAPNDFYYVSRTDNTFANTLFSD